MGALSSILVTGGAGYVGSHATLALLAAGRRVVVLDDLSAGRRDLVADAAVFVQGKVEDRALVADLIAGHGVSAVIHFAGSIVASESVTQPLAYYRNNTVASQALIETCVTAGVQHFIFSSTAAVYGMPNRLPVTEDSPTAPINPYGASKLMTEWMLRDAAAAHGLRYAALRYFNVAGADPLGRSGQCSRVATHLIKIAGEAVVGKRAEIALFGDDYDTPDGTCIRDYIHVADLADAHVRALDYLEAGGASLIANCGYGRGHSVRAVLDAVARAAGMDLPVRIAPRRAGDPPALVAGAERIRAVLGWKPAYDDLDLIVRHALAWERRL